jgi:hypothetical protein
MPGGVPAGAWPFTASRISDKSLRKTPHFSADAYLSLTTPAQAVWFADAARRERTAGVKSEH